MSNHGLPSLSKAYSSLCANGDIPEINTHVTPIDNYWFVHPKKGKQTVAADPRMLKISKIYLNDSKLAPLLRAHGAETGSLQDIKQLMRRLYADPTRLIWGFCGYASSGFPYTNFAKLLTELYKHLTEKQHRPALVTDGGGSKGVLGINSVLAQKHNIPSLRIIPPAGLAELAWGTYTAIIGRSFPERQQWVARFPDILVCGGGGEGTFAERALAVAMGTPLLDLTIHEYPTLIDGNVIVCRSLKDIKNCIVELEALARYNLEQKRAARLKLIDKI